MLIVDAHLDLAMNAIEWNRDLTRPIDEIRAREHGQTDRPDRGKGTVSFAEMRRGKVGLCVATQIARYSTREHPFPGWHSPEQAWAMTQAQLAWYRAMEERGELVQVRGRGRARSSIWPRGTAMRQMGRSATSSASRAPIRSSPSVTSNAPTAMGCAPWGLATTARASTRRAPTPRATSARAGASSCARWIGSA